MEDVAMLNLTDAMVGSEITLVGWLADREDGLFLLDNHHPEDINHLLRIRLVNGDVMYPILASVPSLVGGMSLIFSRARVSGILINAKPLTMIGREISVEIIRGSGIYVSVNISQDVVNKYVEERGAYQFGAVRPSARDWLKD
ncbi:hypothetical protein [Cupriavidus sp. DL-D2]|uniref:hypothetical protein n=1 Tax=Cupriavidus sp. DL-D2 TaxID=3144974 RepID=UPI0032146917